MKRIKRGFLLAVVALLLPLPVVAQSSEVNPLSVHGFLSQGFARSWRNTVVGIPTDGTFDYRVAAIQFSYAFSPVDQLVLQVNHRRMGTNPLEGDENDVRLDWGFYQRSLGRVGVRVGKVPMPRGLFNEIRDVGTALPFYRAPYFFYSESAETLDGVVASFAGSLAGGWSAEVDGFVGRSRIDYVAQGPDSVQVLSIDTRSGHGGQLWIEPPVPGLRLGIGGARYRVAGAGTDAFHASWQLSGEWLAGPLVARTEYGHVKVPGFKYTAYYGQAGVLLGHGLMFNVQAESADFTMPTPFGETTLDWVEDQAIGLSWAVRPTVVMKLEGHRMRGYATDDFIPIGGSPARPRYVVGSIAVAF